MSAIVVSELIAELGLDVKQSDFAAGQRGLDAIERVAVQLVRLCETLERKLSGVGAAAAGAGAAVKDAVAFGPALPPGFNSALEDEKAAILRAQEAAALRQNALTSLGTPGQHGPELPPGFTAPEHSLEAFGPALPEGYNRALEEEKSAIIRAREQTALHAKAIEALDGKAEHAAHGGLAKFLHSAEGLVSGFLALEGVHLITHFAHQMVELGSSTEHAATRLGLSVEAVQQLRYAANQTDIAVGSLDAGLRFLQVNAVAASKGSKEQAGAFTQIGVAVKDANGHIKSTDTLFEETAEGIAKIEDPAQRTAVAVKIFGRGANELIPLLAGGAEGIRKYREEAEALGGGFGEEAIHKSAELEKALKRFDFIMLSVKGTIATYLLPILVKLTEGFSKLATGARALAKHSDYLATVLGTALYIAMWTRIVPALLAVEAATWKTIFANAVAVAEWALIGAAVAAFALVVEDLYQLLTGNESQIGLWLDEWLGIGTADDLVRSWSAGIDTLKESIKSLGEVASEVWGVVSNPVGALIDLAAKGKESDIGKLGMHITGAAEDVIAAGSAYANAGTADPIARATGRGIGAGAVFDQGTPRAVARGLTAGLQQGSAGFGQASRSAVGGATVVDASTHVHVEKAGASAAEIAEHVERKQGEQARRIKHALAPAPAKK